MQQITPVSGQNQTALALEQSGANGGYGAYREADAYPDGEPSFNIRELVAIVRANLLIIGIIVAAMLALALIVTMLQTPRYTAVTTLQINDQSAQILGKQDDTAQDPIVNSADTDRFLRTQVDICPSSEHLAQVAA